MSGEAGEELKRAIKNFVGMHREDRSRLVSIVRDIEQESGDEDISLFFSLIRHPYLFDKKGWAALYGAVLLGISAVLFTLGFILVIPVYTGGGLPVIINETLNYTMSLNVRTMNLALILLGYAFMTLSLSNFSAAWEILRMSGLARKGGE